MSPEKRLKVRGIRVFGLTSIRTFFSVCTKTYRIGEGMN